MGAIDALQAVPRLGTLSDDLGRLFAHWQSGKQIQIQREAIAANSLPAVPQGTSASLHPVRLWAAEEVSRKIRKRAVHQAIELGTLYQLVTPVTGAVVLESAVQYAAADLHPVDPTTVPSIPEPTPLILMLLGLLIIWKSRSLATKHSQKG